MDITHVSDIAESSVIYEFAKATEKLIDNNFFNVLLKLHIVKWVKAKNNRLMVLSL